MVAVAMTRISVRKPPTMMGEARGSSIRTRRTWRPVRPMPRAASSEVLVHLAQPGIGTHQDGRDGQHQWLVEDGQVRQAQQRVVAQRGCQRQGDGQNMTITA